MLNNEQKPTIILIDEHKLELRTSINNLKKVIPSSIEIRGIIARPHLDDYFDILNELLTSCIIIDQKLKVNGDVEYTGIELAAYIRNLKPKIPLYILTNVADDPDEFLGGEWTVEDIISKKDLNDTDALNMIAARIVRHINVYEDIVTEREKRYHDLLVKSFEGNLDNDNIAEIEELQIQKQSPALAEELSQLKQLEELIKEHENLIGQFKHYLT